MKAIITGKSVEVTVQKYLAEEGFVFGVWAIYRNGEKVFQSRPKLKKNSSIAVISGTSKINSKASAKRLIENHGELRVNKSFQKKIMGLLKEAGAN